MTVAAGSDAGSEADDAPPGRDDTIDDTIDDQGPDPTGGSFDVGGFIRHRRQLAQMSVRRLAELADVSNPYLSQVERGLRKPSAEILQQVANALKISVETLYVKAGFLPDEERRTNSVPEAIEADPHLTDDQKRALLNVYQSFVATE